ncbi:MAG: helix-turn-helix transcriptional regulator [Desulfovibrio sp.]
MQGSLATKELTEVCCLRDASRVSSVRAFSHISSSAETEPIWRERKIRPGLRVTAFDGVMPIDFSFDYQKQNKCIDFAFFLEGTVLNHLGNTPWGSKELSNAAGYGGMGFLHEMTGRVKSVPTERVRLIHLHVSPFLLHELLLEDISSADSALKNVLENQGEMQFMKHERLTPFAQMAANELFYALVGNSHSRLYLEGKALELIGLQAVNEHEVSSGKRTILSPSEVEQICEIQNYLITRFDSPPNMQELTSLFGLSLCKVQAGFKELFGMSVFGYLKEYRLQKAKMLLEEGQMNVSEVAWSIGYTNLSHFSTAFRKRYGILPKRFLNFVRGNKVKVEAHRLSS